jgi:MFS family permease
LKLSEPARESDSPVPPLVFDEQVSAKPDPPSPSAQEGWEAMFRALRHRNFRLFVIGQIISLIGTWMQTVAQSWLVYRLTGSEWLLGVTWFCTHIPVFVLGPLGGLAADRYSRHKLVLVAQVLSMLQALALAILTLMGAVQVWHILALACTLGVINAFDMPGRQSLLIEMTGKADLLNAISLNSAIFNAARVAGPALAGILVAGLGEGFCFLLNAFSFVAVIACLLLMRLPAFVPRAPASPWIHLMDGFRYAHRTRTIRVLLAVVGAATLGGMPALVLMPFFADGIFHRGSQGLGFLMGAMGTGAVVGTLVLARRTKTSGLMDVVFFSALGLGASFVLFAVSPSFYLSLAIMPVIGFTVMRQNASANTVIQVTIPDEYRGRIMALYAMTVVGLGPFGSLAAGALAHHAGPRLTVLLGGVACLTAAALFRLNCPRGVCEGKDAVVERES